MTKPDSWKKPNRHALADCCRGRRITEMGNGVRLPGRLWFLSEVRQRELRAVRREPRVLQRHMLYRNLQRRCLQSLHVWDSVRRIVLWFWLVVLPRFVLQRPVLRRQLLWRRHNLLQWYLLPRRELLRGSMLPWRLLWRGML